MTENPLCPHCGASTHVHRYLKDDRRTYICTACKRTHRDRSDKPVGRPLNPDKPTKAEIQRDYRARMTPERRDAENVKQRDRRAKRKLKQAGTQDV